MERHVPETKLQDSYDYIVVGAGSSGCVLANRLSADPNVSVLLLESGPKDTSALIAMPRGLGKLHNPKDPNVKFYSAGAGGNRPDEVWFKGSTLGGSSSINGMVYARGAPMDYDGWEARGCAGWGWKDIGPCFMELEDHELGHNAAAWRGAGGPLKVSMHPVHHALTEAVLEAGAQNGAPRVPDINDVHVVREGGMGYMTRTISRGKRVSAADAFLKPIVSRPNLHVATHTQTLKIVFQGKRAIGVLIRDAGGTREVASRGEILLCAGALESPKLLQLSGVGPSAVLAPLGIDTIVDSPDVGRNLRDHRYLPVMYRVREGSLNGAFRGFGLLVSLIKYLAGRSGPLTHAAHEVAGFIKTQPGLDHADAQLGIGLYTIKLTPTGHGIGDGAGMTIGGYYSRPQSQGTLGIVSTDPDVNPRIDINSFDAEQDRLGSIAMLRWIRRLAEQPALKPYILEELSPGPAVQNDDEIMLALRAYGSTAFHVAGTCRMGADDASVVDPHLRVRGVHGLRVCDTSVFPTLVSGNTSAPAMAVALRLAQIMKAETLP
jgi:choline dehydrogenase-like flavoprotein